MRDRTRADCQVTTKASEMKAKHWLWFLACIVLALLYSVIFEPLLGFIPASWQSYNMENGEVSSVRENAAIYLGIIASGLTLYALKQAK
jgi:hypothetical protein